MMRRLMPSIWLLVTLLCPGCYSVTMGVEADRPVLLNYGPVRGQRFREETRVYYLGWGLVNLSPNAVDELLAATRTGKPVAVNLSTRFDLIGLATLVGTLGVVSSRVVVVEGEL